MQARAEAHNKLFRRVTSAFSSRANRPEGAQVENRVANYLGYQWNDAHTTLLKKGGKLHLADKLHGRGKGRSVTEQTEEELPE